VAFRVAGAQDRSPAIGVSASLDAHIKDVANRYRVSADLVVAIIEAESAFNPRAVSRRGARGLMQLMPRTAATLGVGDPFDPRENIEAGVRHLRALMDQFDNNLPLVLAAYNAGGQAVIDHGGIPPYRQTRQYVNRILRRLDRDGAKTRRS
jgi:soluble lytic murein transglycosylase-like protein